MSDSLSLGGGRQNFFPSKSLSATLSSMASASTDARRMRIYVRAPQVYAGDLHAGMQATLELPEHPGRTFAARIATTSNAINPKSRSLLVELQADNAEGQLRPGDFAQVRFELPSEENAVSLPASTLVFRDQGTFVAIVNARSRFKLMKVDISRDYGSRVEIAAGLPRDACIVANPQETLSMPLYRDGVASYLDVVTAQDAALQSQRAMIAVHTRSLAEHVALMLALGGGWTAPFDKQAATAPLSIN